MILVDPSSALPLVCHNPLFATIKREKIVEAVLGLLGLFYLLDIDYHKHQEVGLTIMQNLFLGDKSTPGDLINTISLVMADFNKFINID